MMSLCCGNPMHPFFWFRVGGMRRRWARVRRTRGWGGSEYSGDMDGIAMMRRGTWGDGGDGSSQRGRVAFSQADDQQQRGLLSVAVEFLFGDSPADSSGSVDNNLPPSKELEKWKFRASVIVALSSASRGNGISLRELLPYVDNPPASADHPSAIRETLRIVTYFNGRPADRTDEASNRDDRFSGMDARFCFPEIVAEMDCSRLLTLGSSDFAPPESRDENGAGISSILYREDDEYGFGSSTGGASGDGVPEYLHERPHFLTRLSRQQFGQCALLGLLNLVGIIWVQNALMPGGLLALPVPGGPSKRRGGDGSLVAIGSFLVLKLFGILRFYAGLFFVLPLCRLAIVLARNTLVNRRNWRRLSFVRAEL